MSEKKRVRIVDVATAAQLSVATVSRYFNDPDSLSPDTQRRVAEAVRQLNYRPNFSAKSLRKGQSNIIIILTRDISNPNYSLFFGGAERLAQARGYITLYCNLGMNEDIEKRYYEFCFSQGVAGIIGFAIQEQGDNMSILKHGNIPVVLLDSEATSPVLANLETNVYQATYEGTKYLLNMGHRHIAFLNGNTKMSTARKRLQGYLDAVRDFGHDVVPIPICDQFSEESGFSNTVKLLLSSQEITAFFPASNQLTRGCFRALRECGIDIPGKVSLLGFDNSGHSSLYSPPLTVVSRTDIEHAGTTGMNILLNYLESGACPQNLKLDYPMQIIIRSSCQPPAKT